MRTFGLAATAAIMLMTVACGRRQVPAEPMTVEVMNGYTPVKNQGKSQTCWAYAMLAAIETEHIMRGDSVHLSVDYAVRSVLADAFRQTYLTRGRRPVVMRGTALRLINAITAHGIVPYDACHGGKDANTTILARKVGRMAEGAANAGAGLGAYDGRLQRLLDETMGPVPRRVFMLGAEYTPQEFARSVCAPGEYVALTSFTHHPFYTGFVLEVPDNFERDVFYNVPIDTLMQRMEHAVRAGRGVCWEGDISEPGFSFARGIARLPDGTPTTQADRQRAFERFATTDDHCMAVVGLARDSRGRKYFVMKNSWGTANPYGGLMYVSEDYVRLKTIAVVMSTGR